ncbi:MAG TPA: class I SAM-dependent methyltransferase [Saprospiraceae bacterium]|nr:class I SAM-dependent methyltransferase [Saprospiraceae bacterium]
MKGHFPIYIFAEKLDGVNFSTETFWEGKIKEGPNYKFHSKRGYQYICEATHLNKIPDKKYDFILSCHSLEHSANPLKVVEECKRVLKKGGYFILVLPDKENTFDRKRPFTTMSHLLKDYHCNTGEEDETHFEEVRRLFDFSMVDKSMEMSVWLDQMPNNINHRLLHHHVFNFELITEIFKFFSFEVIIQKSIKPFHLVTIARCLEK